VSTRPARDSRGERRRAVEINATVSVDGRSVAVKTRDISRSGICLVSGAEIKRDSELTISLVLSLGKDAVSEPLAVTGNAVWCTALFGKYQIGVKFIRLDAERRRFLDLFMRFIDGEVSPAGHDMDTEEREAEPLEDKDDPFRP